MMNTLAERIDPLAVGQQLYTALLATERVTIFTTEDEWFVDIFWDGRRIREHSLWSLSEALEGALRTIRDRE